MAKIRKWSLPHREPTPIEEFVLLGKSLAYTPKQYIMYEEAKKDWSKDLAKDCARDVLKELHAFNKLNQHTVASVGEYFGINAQFICREEGITYDIT